MKAIINGKIITPFGISHHHTLVFDQHILGIHPEDQIDLKHCDSIYDAKGNYISPGFIDLHVHGCSGSDTMDATADALSTISLALSATGVTSFLPTTMTDSKEKVWAALRNIAANKDKVKGASILGCHLEGPFLNTAQKGAQDPEKFTLPSIQYIEPFNDILKLITFAPETSDSSAFIDYCMAHGIYLSIGHSGATYEQAMLAISRGVCHCTHLFNGMAPLHHRNPGVVGAALCSDISCEIIVDNHHLHTAMPSILYKAKGIDKLVLVTDAMRACGMPDGDYDLGGQKVTVKEGVARTEGGSLAGSILTMNLALKNFIANTGLSLFEAIKIVTSSPASVIGIQHNKGILKKGYDADITIFDMDFNIYKTYTLGESVFERTEK